MSAEKFDSDKSSYEYWRSQYKAGGNGDDSKRSKEDVFTDAICNRLGEEFGQNINRLVWPEIPGKLKGTLASLAGRFGPLLLGSQKLWSWTNNNLLQEKQLLTYVLRRLSVVIDGVKTNQAIENWSMLFSLLANYEDYWVIRFDSHSALKLKMDSQTGDKVLENTCFENTNRFKMEVQDGSDLFTVHDTIKSFVKAWAAQQLMKNYDLSPAQAVGELNSDEKAKLVQIISAINLLQNEGV